RRRDAADRQEFVRKAHQFPRRPAGDLDASCGSDRWGGFNGSIPGLTNGEAGVMLRQGFVTYGSDSGHRLQDPPEWTLSDEAIKNLGYMQLKKTHDAAMVLMKRAYGELPRYNYF